MERNGTAFPLNQEKAGLKRAVTSEEVTAGAQGAGQEGLGVRGCRVWVVMKSYKTQGPLSNCLEDL